MVSNAETIWCTTIYNGLGNNKFDFISELFYIYGFEEKSLLQIDFFSTFVLLISTHEILGMSDSAALKFNYSDSFVLSTTLIYKNECYLYEYNVDIKPTTFEICLIQMPTQSDL